MTVVGFRQLFKERTNQDCELQIPEETLRNRHVVCTRYGHMWDWFQIAPVLHYVLTGSNRESWQKLATYARTNTSVKGALQVLDIPWQLRGIFSHRQVVEIPLHGFLCRQKDFGISGEIQDRTRMKVAYVMAFFGSRDVRNPRFVKWLLPRIARIEFDTVPLLDLSDYAQSRPDWPKNWTMAEAVRAMVAWEAAQASESVAHLNRTWTIAPGELDIAGTYVADDGYEIEYQALMSEYDLGLESQKMHHCVRSYWRSVRTGVSAIYHIETPDGPFTVEVGRDQWSDAASGLGVLAQVKGKYNARMPQEIENRLFGWMECLTERWKAAQSEAEPAEAAE